MAVAFVAATLSFATIVATESASGPGFLLFVVPAGFQG